MTVIYFTDGALIDDIFIRRSLLRIPEIISALKTANKEFINCDLFLAMNEQSVYGALNFHQKTHSYAMGKFPLPCVVQVSLQEPARRTVRPRQQPEQQVQPLYVLYQTSMLLQYAPFVTTSFLNPKAKRYGVV